MLETWVTPKLGAVSQFGLRVVVVYERLPSAGENVSRALYRYGTSLMPGDGGMTTCAAVVPLAMLLTLKLFRTGIPGSGIGRYLVGTKANRTRLLRRGLARPAVAVLHHMIASLGERVRAGVLRHVRGRGFEISFGELVADRGFGRLFAHRQEQRVNQPGGGVGGGLVRGV